MVTTSITSAMRFDSLTWEYSERLLRQLQDDEQEQDKGNDLCCAHCGRPITREDQRIPIQGRYEHAFRNPHGIFFHIGCFETAPGCEPLGEATEEWTWFPGYSWQVALCMGCGTHLGWRYRSRTGDLFHGLILDRLSECHSE
jgi:hypothetical protein